MQVGFLKKKKKRTVKVSRSGDPLDALSSEQCSRIKHYNYHQIQYVS